MSCAEATMVSPNPRHGSGSDPQAYLRIQVSFRISIGRVVRSVNSMQVGSKELCAAALAASELQTWQRETPCGATCRLIGGNARFLDYARRNFGGDGSRGTGTVVYDHGLAKTLR